MRPAIIVNPAAGRGTNAAARKTCAERLVRDAAVDAPVMETRHRGHAAELAASFAAAGHDRIVVWGGDGTINEVASALIGKPVALGAIAGGSGDGFVRSLGLPRTPELAFKVALGAPAGAVDVGWLGNRHFLNIGGIGFDAAVAARFNRRIVRGVRGYIVDSLREVWSYHCDRYSVTVDGTEAVNGPFEGPRFLVAFANGREYGSGLVLAPAANVADGQLDLVLVAGGGALRQCWRARRLAFRRLAPAEGLRRLRVTAAVVRGDRMLCHVDGETFEAGGEVAVRVSAGALRVAGAGGWRTWGGPPL